MIHISLTDFVDFVSTSGTTRLSKVRTLVERGDYHPCQDYYKSMREIIVEMHRAARSGEDLDSLVNTIKNPSKAEHYGQVARSYQKRMIKRDFRRATWFDPPAGEWMHRCLAIKVNPELGLNIDGKRHVVKLYFKVEELAPRQAHVINRMMAKGLQIDEATHYAVLDTRRGKLHRGVGRSKNLDALLQGEAEAFITMYESLAA